MLLGIPNFQIVPHFVSSQMTITNKVIYYENLTVNRI